MAETLAEYRRFNQGDTFTERYAPEPECPVVSTSWYQAAAYCNWLSKEEGLEECYEIKGPTRAVDVTEADWRFHAVDIGVSH